jgi:hypothetical protein
MFCVFRKKWSNSQAFCRFRMTAFEGALIFPKTPALFFFCELGVRKFSCGLKLAGCLSGNALSNCCANEVVEIVVNRFVS